MGSNTTNILKRMEEKMKIEVKYLNAIKNKKVEVQCTSTLWRGYVGIEPT